MKDFRAGEYLVERVLGWLLRDSRAEFVCVNRPFSLLWFLLGLFVEETFLRSCIFLNILILPVVLRERYLLFLSATIFSFLLTVSEDLRFARSLFLLYASVLRKHQRNGDGD